MVGPLGNMLQGHAVAVTGATDTGGGIAAAADSGQTSSHRGSQ